MMMICVSFALPVCNIRLTTSEIYPKLVCYANESKSECEAIVIIFSVKLRSFQCHVCNSNGDPNGCSEADPGPLVGYMTDFVIFGWVLL